MTACIASFDLNVAANALSQWVVQSVIFGTLLAIATWSLLQLARRRCGHTVHGIVWLIVLLKFIIPVGPSWSLSMASGVGLVHDFSARLAQRLAPTSDATAPVSTPGGVSPAIPILVMLHGSVRPAAQAALSDARPEFPIALILSGAYLIGVAAVGSRRIWLHRKFAARCGRLPPADGATRAIVEAACRRLGQERVPTVRIGDDVPAPFILGALRPTLVLPSRQLETPAELQAVVLHEIAHLRRGDLFVRYLQWITGTLLFFWPVVAWVNRRIDLARESACDDWALRHGQLTEGEYARCLLRALRSVHRPKAAIGIAAMAANKKNVERRIEMILDKSAHSRPRRWLALPVAVLLVAWATFVLTGSAEARVAHNEKNLSSDKGSAGTSHIVVEHLGADGKGTAGFTVEYNTDVHEGALIELRRNVRIAHGFHKAMFIAESEDGAPGEHASFVVMALGAGPSAEQLAEFAASHPTADADGDGTVSKIEHDAYLVALAMAEPAAVIDQFASADRNKDGQLDAAEAADLVSHSVSFAHGGDLHFEPGHNVARFGGEHRVEIAGVIAAEFGPHGDDAELHEHGELKFIVEGESEIDFGSDEEHFVIEIPKLTLKDRRGEDKDGPVLFSGPAMNHWVSAPNAAHWLLDNVSARPTAAEVAEYVPVVTNAPLIRFLEMHPEADTNEDGTLTSEERDAFLHASMARIHTKLIERFPAAGADCDLDKAELFRFHQKAGVHNSFQWTDKDGNVTSAKDCLLHKADGHVVVELKSLDGKLQKIEIERVDGKTRITTEDSDGEVVVEEIDDEEEEE